MANPKKNILILFILLLVCTSFVYSQTEPDSTNFVQTDTTKFVMQKSPWGAVLRSAVIPGFGQFYNESYWKVPVVWGFLGYFIYVWNDQNNLYKQYSNLFSGSLTSDKEEWNETYYKLREFYRDQRNTFAVYIGLTYLLQLVDAYVDAQLFDFSVEENKQFGTMNLSIKYWIK